jgi:dTDP-4-dehydrorhamnose 3,5-epimerase
VFARHFGVELSAGNRWTVYVPEGCAHGFQSLEDDSEVFYQMSRPFVPDAAAGFRWNDPAFAIEWPLELSVISTRDRSYADFRTDSLWRALSP